MAQQLNGDSRRARFGNIRASRILAILGERWFAEFTAINTPGRVLWCNFELARALGFDVPDANRMTPRFHQQLIDALSYRVRPRKTKVNAHKTINLYADRYGGEGLGPALGAGRSGFLPFGNFYLKGVGITPLFRHDDPGDLAHSHGGMQLNDCLGEAVFGEVGAHLLTSGSTRILAIIDQGEYVTYPHGRVPIALAVRSGGQLRPGHLLSRQIPRRSILETFLKITKETKQLATGKDSAGRKMPDLKATMLRIIDDHARTTAEQFRWRMIHGAVTSSNMEMSGALLDLTTQTTQPRTAPVCFALEDVSFFGLEHIGCARQLGQTYRALIKSIPERQRPQFHAKPFNLVAQMRKVYFQHLQVELLSAAGLKRDLAERIQKGHAGVAQRFTEIIVRMCELRNPGNIEMARRLVENVSVLDVFNLLREFPRTYFAHPKLDHTKSVRAALKPVFRGNRFHVAKKRATVTLLIKEFVRAYRELMNTAELYTAVFYDDPPSMQFSIASRAAFENLPLELYRTTLYKEFDDAIQSFKSNGDAGLIRQVIDRKIRESLRNVDALLAQGESRRLRNNGYELERKTIDGINYSIRAWDDRRQTRFLCVRVPVTHSEGYFEIHLPGWPRLTGRQLRALSYRFTTDAWATSETREIRLEKQPDGSLHLVCEGISGLPLIGRLEGIFCLSKSRDSWVAHEGARCAGYTFAIPDKQELAKLIARV